jgi:hypothetical protein
MAIDFPATHQKVFARYPHLRSTAFERNKLFTRHLHSAPPQLLSEVPVMAIASDSQGAASTPSP